jgi:hypothetical protein
MTARIVWDGTPSTVITTTATIATTAWSASAQSTTFDNTGASDKWQLLRFVITVTFSGAPAVGKSIGIYCSDVDVDGTSGHSLTPASGTTQNNARLVAISSPIRTDTSVQYLIAKCASSEIKKGLFQIRNDTGQTIASGLTMTVEGISSEDV